MRLRDNLRNDGGASLLEILFFAPLALLAVGIAAEGNRYFETRTRVIAAMRQALLPQLGEDGSDANSPRVTADKVAQSLLPLGRLQLAIIDVSLAIDPRSGFATGMADLRSAEVGHSLGEPQSLTRAALKPFLLERPHPFAVPLSLIAEAPIQFRTQTTIRVVSLRLIPHRSVAPFLSAMLSETLSIESAQIMPLRSGLEAQ